LIVFHVLIPFTLDHFRPATAIKFVMRKWFEVVGDALDLTPYLLDVVNNIGNVPADGNDNPNQPVVNNAAIYYPPSFRWRVSVSYY